MTPSEVASVTEKKEGGAAGEFVPIAIDLETGGVDVGVNPVLSVAAVCSEGTFHRYVIPVEGMVIDARAAEVNGYTEDRWRELGAVEMRQAAADLKAWLISLKVPKNRLRPVAHNAAFDRGFLAWMGRVTHYEFPLDYHWECTMSMLSTLIRAGVVPAGRVNLDRLCALTGFNRKEPHDALCDAHGCLLGLEWMVNLVRGLREKGGLS